MPEPGSAGVRLGFYEVSWRWVTGVLRKRAHKQVAEEEEEEEGGRGDTLFRAAAPRPPGSGSATPTQPGLICLLLLLFFFKSRNAPTQHRRGNNKHIAAHPPSPSPSALSVGVESMAAHSSKTTSCFLTCPTLVVLFTVNMQRAASVLVVRVAA